MKDNKEKLTLSTISNDDAELIQDEETRKEFTEYFMDENGFEPTEEELTDYMIEVLVDTTKKSSSPFSNLVGFFFIIWFIASMIGIFYFMSTNPTIGLMIFGQYFFVFGMMALFNKQAIGFIFTLVGAGIIIVPLLVSHPEFIPMELNWEFLGIFLFGFVFFAIGVGITISTIVADRNFKNRCSLPILATIVAESKNSHSTKFPLYKFRYNDRDYKVRGNSSKIINIGEQVEIMINPSKPGDVYFKDSGYPVALILFITIPFILSGLFVMVMAIIEFL